MRRGLEGKLSIWDKLTKESLEQTKTSTRAKKRKTAAGVGVGHHVWDLRGEEGEGNATTLKIRLFYIFTC